MASPAMPAAGTGWKIDSQTPTTGTANNQVSAGYSISFTTGRGHSGVIFVPASQYNIDNVRAKVTDAATNLDNIGALTG